MPKAKQTPEQRAREKLRKLLDRKALTHDDEIRGMHAGLFLIASYLEEVVAYTVGLEHAALSGSERTALYACGVCGNITHGPATAPRSGVIDCPSCGELAAPLPPGGRANKVAPIQGPS